MAYVEYEEKARKIREALVNCSAAMREAIQSYGFAATLDFVVRISNYDSIVRELLPHFPSIASAAMLEASNLRRSSKMAVDSPEEPVTESELLNLVTG